MPRVKHNDEKYAIQQVNTVLSNITDHGRKTWRDLWDVAYQWCSKNYAHSEQTAAEWGVEPIYLILAALLYIEHPLLVGEGRSWLYSLVEAQKEILRAELHRLDLAVPILPTVSVHSPC